MPKYIDRFGPEAFTRGDAIDHALIGSMGSAACQPSAEAGAGHPIPRH
eukprot:CAMPEP_0185467520 /NCGR_PEP_ID=MMETSP1365-20130426/97271_1 /TAXON_ID=38817 /ORGANISM="Gephyrocapsa oceanica, Strain RCC1303" /LENGTH=47 /DNA_ID= /DNA_START= /DNA_END= /DNA_ORIENTATION=